MSIAADNTKGARARAWAGRALAWWFAELRATYRDAARRLDIDIGNPVILEAGERYWVLRQRQRVLGQIDRDTADPTECRRALLRAVAPAQRRRAILVEIPQERALMKRVALPAVAQRELDRILGFEIARHFPFPAERVHFGHRIVGRAAEGEFGPGTIEVELVALPRDVTAEICSALARAGLVPGAIAVAGARGENRLVLPTTTPRRSGSAIAPRDRALILAVAILGLAALASPLIQQRVRLAEVDRELAALKPEAQAMLERDARERQLDARTAAILSLRATRPPSVAVLDALTKAVPDGSWFLSLGLSGRDILLDGLSPSAATTALALERSHAFSDVTFRAPITRDPGTGLEHFQFSARIVEPKP
jgi:general secretion pathway protein L